MTPQPTTARYTNKLTERASARDALERGPRRRVCLSCLLPTDHVLGTVHSEDGCHRCGTAPCFGRVVEDRGTVADRKQRVKTAPQAPRAAKRISRQVHHCANCQRQGHNRKTCPGLN